MALRSAALRLARLAVVAPHAAAPAAAAAPLLRRYAAAAGAPPASRVLEVRTDAEYAAALNSTQGLVVTDFTAKWCGPCKLMAPVFEALAKEHEDVKFIKVDIDTEALAASVRDARVSAVPTFAFHKAGVPVGEIRGADAAGVRAAVAELKHS